MRYEWVVSTTRRTDEEMLDLILGVARADPRIRAVTLAGSRVEPTATKDQFNDFDIVYLVNDLPSLLRDERWLDAFGEPLIVQRPDDWFSHPYDFADTANYAYLMYFRDGQRIDLTLVDRSRFRAAQDGDEPRRVLLDKDNLAGLEDLPAGTFGRVSPPGEREFADTCNEFWWGSLSAAKGIARGEILSAKTVLERYQLDMLLKLLAWQAGLTRGFPLAVGKFSKYLPRLLSAANRERLDSVLWARDLADQWRQLLDMCALFDEAAEQVAGHFGFEYDREQTRDIRGELERIRRETRG